MSVCPSKCPYAWLLLIAIIYENAFVCLCKGIFVVKYKKLNCQISGPTLFKSNNRWNAYCISPQTGAMPDSVPCTVRKFIQGLSNQWVGWILSPGDGENVQWKFACSDILRRLLKIKVDLFTPGKRWKINWVSALKRIFELFKLG